MTGRFSSSDGPMVEERVVYASRPS
jgi:hypothetical protein